MSEEKDLQQRLRRIGALVEEIETIADPAARSSTRQLMQLVMEFHGAAIDRALEILANGADSGLSFIDQFGRDPLVGSLLVLYGLHPETLETRVGKAVEQLEAKLRREGATIELLGIGEGAVRMRVTPGAHTCGSTTRALQSAVEDAVYEAAPDIASLSIEGLAGQAASGFVPLEQLGGPPASNTSERAVPPVVAHYGD